MSKEYQMEVELVKIAGSISAFISLWSEEWIWKIQNRIDAESQ